MDKRRTADEAARDLCRQLYEVTDGWSMEWRVVLGEASMHTAVDRAVLARQSVDDSRPSLVLPKLRDERLSLASYRPRCGTAQFLE
jgi:hypothetical protein